MGIGLTVVAGMTQAIGGAVRADHAVREQREEPVAAGRSGASQPKASPLQRSSEPEVRDIQKIGRNDPCYCGSGKKYKKCHGA